MPEPKEVTQSSDRPQALAGLYVLEVADMVAGPFCGKLLAAIGAEVIKVEPPVAGDPSRRSGPFPDDIPHPERSGAYLYLNTGKKSITLNLEDVQGQVILRELASRADVLIHDRHGYPSSSTAHRI